MQERPLLKHALEVGIQSFFSLALLVLSLGIFYPLYAFFPSFFNGYWADRQGLLLRALPALLAGLSIYLLGCWLWFWPRRYQPRPFATFWLLRLTVLSGLTATLAYGLVRAVANSALWAALAYALVLGLACWLLLPWCLAVPRRLPALKYFLPFLLCQMLSLLLSPAYPFLAVVVFLLGLGCLPFVAWTWVEPQLPEAGNPWQILLGLVLLSSLVIAGCSLWLWSELAPVFALGKSPIQQAQRQLRFERPVLRGLPLRGNAFEVYQQIIGRQPGDETNPVLRLPKADSYRIRAGIQPLKVTTELDPDIQARYRPLLDLLRQAGQYSWMQYPLSDEGNLMRMPDLGVIQDLSSLMLFEAINRCRPQDCLSAAQGALDVERFLQDASVHGLLTPAMVAYKQERLLTRLLGQALLPDSLSAEQWQLILKEWQNLFKAETSLFPQLIQLEILSSQNTLLSLLPDMRPDANLENGNLVDWLGILPYLKPGLAGLSQLRLTAQRYFEAESHQQALWLKLAQAQERLMDENPFVAQVLVDISMALLRFREHQMIMRGFYQYLALQAYHYDKGEYPPSLQELLPVYLAALPKDPFTGQAFIYRRQSESFLLYSAGQNGRDDGGKGYFGHFVHQGQCTGEEIVFSPQVPEVCLF